VIPRPLHRLVARLHAQFSNTRVDRDFDRELATHLALLEEDFLRSGMSPEQAYREARRACGGLEQTRQLHRDERRLPWLSRLLQDIRYAARISRKHLGFTVTVVATLGLGIGFSTAIFTVIWATLLAALPYPHAEQLVMIWGRGHNEISVGDYLDWKTASRSFQDIEAWTGGPVTFSPAASSALPKTMRSRRVTSGYFRMQGVPFTLGREFLPQETQPNNSRFVILVNKIWKRLGADPNILGKSLRIDGQPYTVVGVLAPGLEDRGMGDIVVPLAIAPEDRNHDRHWLTAMGRLRPGVSLAQAQSELSAISSHAAAADSDATANAEPAALVEPLKNDFIPPNRIRMLWLLLGAVGFLLLIACVNAANLLLARAAVRRQEMAVRGAMGASPRRLFVQCITESLMLALLGGAAGVAVAYAGLRALVAILPPNTLPSEAELTLSLPVLGFTLAIATLIGIVFGATPALSASHADPADALRGGGRSSAGIAHSQLRRSLVVTEFALALTLLACAALTVHSLVKLMQLDLGVRTDRLLNFNLATPPNRPHDPGSLLAYTHRVLDVIQGIPGVTSIAASAGTPLEDAGFRGPFAIAGRSSYTRPSERPLTAFDAVTPSYFPTLGVHLVAGRIFSDQDDSTSAKVAMVNESFVRHYLADADPLRQQLLLDPLGPPPVPGVAATTPTPIPWQIVGVFHDTRFGEYRHDNPEVLLPLWQNPWPGLSFTVRTSEPPASILDSVAARIHAIDPDAAVAVPRTMEQVRDDALADDRFTVVLFSTFGGAALLLAAVGIFGVMSFSVTQRQREIAVRMALGATRARVVALILREAATLAAIGCGIGLIGALLAGRMMRTLLYGIAGTDIAAFIASAAVLLVTALIACILPARRAALAEPMQSLRTD
jgi:putative ABC transport system permease protein